MDPETLVKEINRILKTTWSENQRASGKWIEVDWGWVDAINSAIPRYRESGWAVTKRVELTSMGRKMWLVFVDPTYAYTNRSTSTTSAKNTKKVSRH